MSTISKGDFTLPGEAGYEQYTLELAKKWGADVIRDSDGTKLSDEIVDAGYRIYSTICMIRQHNAFAAEHPDSQQQRRNEHQQPETKKSSPALLSPGQKINWRVHQYAFPSASPSAMAKSPPGGGSGG